MREVRTEGNCKPSGVCLFCLAPWAWRREGPRAPPSRQDFLWGMRRAPRAGGHVAARIPWPKRRGGAGRAPHPNVNLCIQELSLRAGEATEGHPQESACFVWRRGLGGGRGHMPLYREQLPRAEAAHGAHSARAYRSSCRLWELLTGAHSACGSRSRERIQPAGAAHRSAFSLWELLTGAHSARGSCLRELIQSVGAAHTSSARGSCSRELIQPAGAAHGVSFSLWELRTGDHPACGSCSRELIQPVGAAQELIQPVGAAHRSSFSPWEPLTGAHTAL